MTSSWRSPWSRSSKRALALSRKDSTGESERRGGASTQPAAARTLSCGVRRGVSRRAGPVWFGTGARRLDIPKVSGEALAALQALAVREVGRPQRLASGPLQLTDREHRAAARGHRE